MRDHPDIEAIERTGYPRGYRKPPVCPVCGEELNPSDKVYQNWREVIGCQHCIDEKEAQTVWEDE